MMTELGEEIALPEEYRKRSPIPSTGSIRLGPAQEVLTLLTVPTWDLSPT